MGDAEVHGTHGKTSLAVPRAASDVGESQVVTVDPQNAVVHAYVYV